MDFSPLLGRIPPLLAQAPAPAPAAQFSGGVGGFLGHVGPVAIGVLILLGIFSFLSWAIIIYKGMALHRAHRQSDTFLQVFRKSSKFSEVNSVCAQLKSSPLVGVFQAGYMEVNQQVRGGSQGASTQQQQQKPTVRSLESLSRALARAATVENTRLERRVSFLATTASVTPFFAGTEKISPRATIARRSPSGERSNSVRYFVPSG